MGNENREKWWVRLKKFVQRKKVNIGTGDGGAYTNKYLPITQEHKDSLCVIKDTAVVAHPKKQ